MIKLLYLLSVLVFYINNDVECSNIHDALQSFYGSESHQLFSSSWNRYQQAFETEIASSLQENFGSKAVNIYEPDRLDSHLVAGGFHLTDGVVTVYFFEMVLRELPGLIRPELSLDLSSNRVKVKSKVGRMFIDTTYYVSRNASTLIYARPEDQKELSPFSLQQVDNFGKVVIVGEDCLLSGLSTATLYGDSVNLGHSSFLLRDCKFMVEISTPNSGAPPVIAPYFPKGPKETLEVVMSNPLRDELHTKLQGAMFTYINVTVLLGKEAAEFRKSQQKLFKSYANFIMDYVAKLNEKTLKANKGHTSLQNYEIIMDTTTDKNKWVCHMALRELMLYGLDTAYVARTGGPYRDSDASTSNTAADAIIFSSMQVRGKISHDDGNGSIIYDFAAELKDISVHIVMDIDEENTKLQDVLLTGWRSLDFSIIPWETQYKERHGYQSLLYGHVLNELPVIVTDHLTSILGKAVVETKDDDDSTGGGDNADKNEDGGDEDRNIDDNNNKAIGDKKTKNKNTNDFFSDDLDENFFSDADFFSDDGIEKDFFTDDNIKEGFLSEFESDAKKDDGKFEGDVEGSGGTKESVDDETVENDTINDKVVNDNDEKGVAEADGENVEVSGETGVGVDDKDVKKSTITNVGVDGNDEKVVVDEDADNLDMPSGTEESVDDETVANDTLTNENVSDNDQKAVADNDAGNVSDETEQGVDKEVVGDDTLTKESMNDDDANISVDDDVEGKNEDKGDDGVQNQASGFLSDDFIEKDFFSDDNIISEISTENNKQDSQQKSKEKQSNNDNESEEHGDLNVKTTVSDADEGDKKQTIADATGDNDKKKDSLPDDNLDEKFFSDDNIEKDLFSDDVIDKDLFSNDGIEKDFFSDDGIEKDFFSDDGIGKDDLDNAKIEDSGDKLNQPPGSDENSSTHILDAVNVDDNVNNEQKNGAKKKLLGIVSEEKYFKRRSMSNDTNIHEAKAVANTNVRNTTNGGDNEDTLEVDKNIEGNDRTLTKIEEEKKMEKSKKTKKSDLPSNVHNTRRQQNTHMSENEIR